MRIASGSLIDGKVVAEATPAQRWFGGLVRSVRFEDGKHGIVHIFGGNACCTHFDNPKLKKALEEVEEMPVLEVTGGGEVLWVKWRSAEPVFKFFV